MTRWVYRQFGGLLQANGDRPCACRPGELRLHTLACGVCHTDVHTWEGRYGLGGGRTFMSPGEACRCAR